jgi:spore germination protein GerM
MRIRSAFSVLVGVVCLVLPGSAELSTSAGQSRGQRRKEVKVYFRHDPGEHRDLSSVKRHVSAASPARGAIEAMLKGPTRAEMENGFVPLIGKGEFVIGSLGISNGTARINFIATRKWLGWPGDLGPIRFRTAVELILKQFPTVEKVVVSLNGETQFADAY